MDLAGINLAPAKSIFPIQETNFAGAKSIFPIQEMNFAGAKSIFPIQEMNFAGAKCIFRSRKRISRAQNVFSDPENEFRGREIDAFIVDKSGNPYKRHRRPP